LSITGVLLSCLIIVSAHAEELHDPTRPIKIDASQTANDNSFAIKAIIISPTKKLVLAGGSALTIGDELMGEKIIDIASNSVKLKTNTGEIIDVSLFDTILKKTSNNSDNNIIKESNL
jgi:hypothetical protein